MGAGIAAQVANAGIDVLLLDIASKGNDPNIVVQKSLERIEKSNPPMLMEPANIEHISIGNIRDNLAGVSDCDWIVEAIVERVDIKRALYCDLMEHLKEGAIVTSNTSTIPISHLMEGMPESLRRRFCITHFFNPVRYMRLLELVKGEHTDAEVMAVLANFCDKKMGKGIVECADTPGFLGNRVGVYAMQATIYEAMALGVSVEEADALFGRPMGIPKTGAFGLYDLIGLDLMADVVRSLRAILPEGDAFHEVGSENPLINSQIKKGFTGNKGKGGFYRTHNGEQLALDLESGQWRPRDRNIPAIALPGEREGLAQLVQSDDRLSKFCWRVLARILTYSANLLPSITISPQDIDDAMKLGYNWVRGPFEMIDELGVEWFVDRLRKDGWSVPQYLADCGNEPIYKLVNGELQVRYFGGEYRAIKLPEGVVRFHLLRRTFLPILENDSASLFHLEGGIRLVEFHSKANALDSASMAVVAEAARNPGPGILVHNDGVNFSAGVNLGQFLEFIKQQDWRGIDNFLREFQAAVFGLLYCNAPVVGAPSGLVIGGGFEILAHCDKVVAHANSVMGLVETGVGLVPGGGGVKETYWRWYQRLGDWDKAAWKTFKQIAYGQTGSSPALSAELCYFEPGRDVETFNRDRLIVAGRTALSQLQNDYSPRDNPDFYLAGEQTYLAMLEFLEDGKKKGLLLAHDFTVASAVASILCGDGRGKKQRVSETEMFGFERENFIRLAKTPQTRLRIESMLAGDGVVRN